MGYPHRVRVQFADTDKMGVAYHARYFESRHRRASSGVVHWFEAARTEMMRTMGDAVLSVGGEGNCPACDRSLLQLSQASEIR